MAAAASRIILKVPIRLMRMTRSKSASGIGPSRPTMRLAGPTPAQFTRTRAGPCAAAACLTAASPEAASDTSQATAIPPMLAATSPAAFSLTSKMATLAPAAASARAVAAPRPDAPPVTMAACPLISMAWLSFSTVALITREDSGTA